MKKEYIQKQAVEDMIENMKERNVGKKAENKKS